MPGRTWYLKVAALRPFMENHVFILHEKNRRDLYSSPSSPTISAPGIFRKLDADQYTTEALASIGIDLNHPLPIPDGRM